MLAAADAGGCRLGHTAAGVASHQHCDLQMPMAGLPTWAPRYAWASNRVLAPSADMVLPGDAFSQCMDGVVHRRLRDGPRAAVCRLGRTIARAATGVDRCVGSGRVADRRRDADGWMRFQRRSDRTPRPCGAHYSQPGQQSTYRPAGAEGARAGLWTRGRARGAGQVCHPVTWPTMRPVNAVAHRGQVAARYASPDSYGRPEGRSKAVGRPHPGFRRDPSVELASARRLGRSPAADVRRRRPYESEHA